MREKIIARAAIAVSAYSVLACFSMGISRSVFRKSEETIVVSSCFQPDTFLRRVDDPLNSAAASVPPCLVKNVTPRPYNLDTGLGLIAPNERSDPG
jgi:hypothetical protein